MISVGQVSGIIAATVFLVEFTVPLAIVIILVGHIGNENSASTWSIVNRVTQISHWPTLLQADTVQTRGVRFGVKFLTWTGTLTLLLMTLAGVITPLGLSDAVKPGTIGVAQFQYVKDEGPWGQSTPPRPDFKFSRLCGALIFMNCPGSYAGYRTFSNSTGAYGIPDFDSATINSTLPNNLTEMFSSATSGQGNTVSGLFDIQYRLYTGVREDHVDHGKTYIQGSFRGVERLVLRNTTQAVEGLVVDTRTGGIGFRNHTVPADLALGGTWSEDLTWIEPITECVDTNLTFEFNTGDSAYNTSVATYLVDNGGFANLEKKYPYPGSWNDTQNPDLRARAYKGAWISNALAAVWLNVTYPGRLKDMNSSIGQKYLISERGSSLVDLGTVSLSSIDGSFLDLGFGSSFGSNTTSLNLTKEASARLSITRTNFTTAGTVCAGAGMGDFANMTNIAVQCGYVFGAAHLTDGRETLLFAPYTSYTRNLYVCASGARASIKTVDFSINGTTSLANLRIEKVSDKTYSSNSSIPLWAVENPNRTLADVTPLWGIVDNRFEGTPGFDFIRAEKFWLPATYPSLTITGSVDSIAGKNIFGAALNSVYTDLSSSSSLVPDYSGQQDFAMFTAWQRLTRAPTTAKLMINLIITDLLAAATVGTKSALDSTKPRADTLAVEAVTTGTPATIMVTKYRKMIQYDPRYAIPACLVLVLWLAIVAVAMVMWVFSRFSLETMRQLLNQTSTGRVATTLLHPEACEPTAKTTSWQRSAGILRIRFDNITPQTKTVPEGATGEKGGIRSVSTDKLNG
ncbi:hypothetical protein K440DRAFT_658621 [Wilcoxina mikolae CBS 423.85]|nr:hypothetical protein K440DRAFT_658621 [Wilcoxina mikolae CBS 423.85]